jgi:hypothetical protein
MSPRNGKKRENGKIANEEYEHGDVEHVCRI